MAPGRLILRNVRPGRRDDYDDEQYEASDTRRASTSDSARESDGDVAESSSSDEDEEDLNAEQSSSDLDGEDVQQQISNVSFGSLLQAQEALSRKRKRDSDSFGDRVVQAEVPKSQSQEIRSPNHRVQTSNSREDRKTSIADPGRSSQPQISKPHFEKIKLDAHKQDREFAESSSDEAPSEEEAPSKSRSSKHAPTSQSSKHQVTRKRTVIDVPKKVSRDPRFDALQQRSAHPGNSEKAYSFLNDYQKSEIAELKAGIKHARTAEDAEKLKRVVGSMENRLKAKRAKEREQEVLRRHRKEEKEKVLQGKQPFYLKRKDVKEQALVEKFKGMKGKEREKLMEKRRRKESQKEKKRMPQDRRVAG